MDGQNRRRKAGDKSVADGRRWVERFTLNQRIQHALTMLSMILLSVTGLALKYHDTWLGRAMISIEGGFETRGTMHRVAAIVLIGLAVYHVFYLLFSDSGHSDLKKMKPSRSDFRNIGFVIGPLTSGEPSGRARFGKFNVRQKVQYFGVMLGTALMVLTGFILWFETQAMAVIPKWMVDVTAVVHGAEGLLIFVILFLWHLYDVHLNPESFPMSRTWLTGRMSMEELRARHPAEYESIFGHQTGGDEF